MPTGLRAMSSPYSMYACRRGKRDLKIGQHLHEQGLRGLGREVDGVVVDLRDALDVADLARDLAPLQALVQEQHEVEGHRVRVERRAVVEHHVLPQRNAAGQAVVGQLGKVGGQPRNDPVAGRPRVQVLVNREAVAIGPLVHTHGVERGDRTRRTPGDAATAGRVPLAERDGFVGAEEVDASLKAARGRLGLDLDDLRDDLLDLDFLDDFLFDDDGLLDFLEDFLRHHLLDLDLLDLGHGDDLLDLDFSDLDLALAAGCERGNADAARQGQGPATEDVPSTQ